MKRLAFAYVRALARIVLARRSPTVVGVTGTAGKTTAVAACARVLEAAFPGKVGHSRRHYNGEWGLPLTVLDASAPGRNPLSWLGLAFRAARLAFFGSYPAYLILEYGIDRPGEMDDLLSVARPDVGIMMPVSPNHVANFPEGYPQYLAEKMKFAAGARKLAVTSDDPQLAGVPAACRFGMAEGSDVRAVDVRATAEGLSWRVVADGKAGPETHAEFFGSYNVQPLLPAFAAARLLGIPLDLAARALDGIAPEEGRGRMLPAAAGNTVVDGTYNGGFAAIKAGLASLREIGRERPSVVLLGDMRELGPREKELHEALVPEIVTTAPDLVVLVGPMMAQYVLEPLTKALPGRVLHFFSSRQAGAALRAQLEISAKSHIIFAKGSQNRVFLEEAVRALLANPADISRLCRQSADWSAKKELFFSTLLSEACRPQP